MERHFSSVVKWLFAAAEYALTSSPCGRCSGFIQFRKCFLRSLKNGQLISGSAPNQNKPPAPCRQDRKGLVHQFLRYFLLLRVVRTALVLPLLSNTNYYATLLLNFRSTHLPLIVWMKTCCLFFSFGWISCLSTRVTEILRVLKAKGRTKYQKDVKQSGGSLAFLQHKPRGVYATGWLPTPLWTSRNWTVSHREYYSYPTARIKPSLTNSDTCK